jgi:predicted kinase
MAPTNVHLICGSTGAGKSTYARGLSQCIRSPVLSIDDWMMTLFGPEVAGPPDWSWISARVARCETQIVKIAVEIGRAGKTSILDVGLLRADRRREIAGELQRNGLGVALHVLDVDAETRWRRVTARNHARGDTYRIEVTRPMFDFVETLWQRPDATELAALNGTRFS